MARYFAAKYQSKTPCVYCGLTIMPGEMMSFIPRGTGGLYHVSCRKTENGNDSAYSQTTTATATINTATINTHTHEENEEKTMPIAVPASNQDAMQTLYSAIQAIAGTSINRATVETIVKDSLTGVNETIAKRTKEIESTVLELLSQHTRELTVTIKRDDTETKRNVGKTHKNFDSLLKICSAHSSETPINVWLTGPAGSGKTKAASQVAEALSLSFYFCGAISEPYALLGYMDANGKLVRTPFREAYENGGVFLMDEIDGSNANAVLSLNAALANGHCAFPDGVIARHHDCIIIAAANTFGLGGTSDYVGRLKMDAASLSRFVWLEWPYDEDLERSLVSNQEWANRVISLRKKVQSLGMKVLITPRATYAGEKLILVGIPQNQVEEMVIRQGMTSEQWLQVRG